MASPTAVKTIRVQDKIFDLESMKDVPVGKSGEFMPVASYEEAVQRVGNDSKRLLAIVNEGLRAEALRSLRTSPDGWFVRDEDQQPTSKTWLKDSFTGTMADRKKVNSAVLTLAKTAFGYSDDLSSDEKKAAKKAAMDFIQASPVILNGMKKNCAVSFEDDVEGDEGSDESES